jgi:hypothetical protein
MKLKLRILLKKNNSSQPKLTHQTRDPSHETRIISLYSNQNKSRSLISNQLNIEG